MLANKISIYLSIYSSNKIQNGDILVPAWGGGVVVENGR